MKPTNPDLMTYQLCLRADGGKWDAPSGVDEHMRGALAMGFFDWVKNCRPLSMKYTILILTACLVCHSVGADELQFSDVFIGGKDGYPAYRIPAVVVSKKGAVLAFAEARQNLSDQAQNDIVLKRSTDGGATWRALQLIHDDGTNSLNNPTAVVEQQSGRVFLMYQRIPGHMTEHSKETATGLDGPNIYRNLLVCSDDDGATWTRPLDVTASTKRPDRATTICSGPGIGIQLTRGPHKGRLIFPFNEGPFWLWQNFSIFSDDAGKNWRTGTDVPGAMVPDAKLGQRSQLNEAQIVEMSDGSVRLDSRQFAGTKLRKTAVSRDGGVTWTSVTDLKDLRDPSCMAGVLRYSFDDGSGMGKIIHTGPDSTKRDHGTVYLSLDDGATFPIKRELYAGSFAYSVPTRLADGRVGVLFEADGNKRIALARFPITWLTRDVNFATVPESRPERGGKFGWWLARHERKLEEAKQGADIVFLGDSITQGWETAGKNVWREHFSAKRALNLGFGGDSTQHVIWRLAHGELDGVNPKVVVLHLGTNNARHSEATPEQIAEGIRAIIETIHAKAPSAKVLLHAIFPRGLNANDPWRKRCIEINKHLPALADGQRVRLLDIGSVFTNADGTISKDIMPDLLHLSAKGYAGWAAALDPELKTMPGDR